MLNNQIIITDDNICTRARRNDRGVVDAAELTPLEWEELRSRNVNSTRVKLVKCAKCWELYRSVQWMRTFNRMGTRVVSHQPGEQHPDHDYDPVETAEHRAYNDRAFMIGEAEGYNPRKEAWAPNRKTRADVLLTGTLTIAYEHQHSPFSATGRYSAPERTRLAAAVGRTAMWHATNNKVRGQVPILRTDGGLPPSVILNPNYRHEFRGGIYRVEIYTCTARDGHECPNRKFSGCGKPHARGQVTAGHLDDVLRGAPAKRLHASRERQGDPGAQVLLGRPEVIRPVCRLHSRSRPAVAPQRKPGGWGEGPERPPAGPLPRQGSATGGDARPRRRPVTCSARREHPPRPRIELLRRHPVLDWRDRRHVASTPGPCRICKHTTILLDDAGRRACKVCVEGEVQDGAL
ncbi:hypothetical protein LUW77_03225 [Streptomyces radiopugnans]|nr:hypothetical protein LUW77_03225 [Streptomyces radiopugnans]